MMVTTIRSLEEEIGKGRAEVMEGGGEGGCVAQVDNLFVVPFHKHPCSQSQNWNQKNSRG